VLVTGASGLLGGRTARALLEQGHDVRVMQRRPARLAGVDEVLADLTDRRAVRRAVSGCEAVVHLAAKVSVAGPWSSFERVNVVGTRLLLEASRAGSVSRFVHVSSPSVSHAGAALVGAPAQPADPGAARGSYARSKALAEQLALASNRPDLSVVAVRPHLVWGPGDQQLVGRVVERARAGRLVLVNHGHALIDTTYVDNAVTALLAALERAQETAGRAFVVTNGEPRTVAELLVRICQALRVPSPVRSVPTAVATRAGAVVERVWATRTTDGEPPMTRFLAEQLATAHWFDQRQTRQALHWMPHVPLEEGFARLATSASGDLDR
jgi:nucleoside-diphosphate-sugar epimerase